MKKSKLFILVLIPVILIFGYYNKDLIKFTNEDENTYIYTEVKPDLEFQDNLNDKKEVESSSNPVVRIKQVIKRNNKSKEVHDSKGERAFVPMPTRIQLLEGVAARKKFIQDFSNKVEKLLNDDGLFDEYKSIRKSLQKNSGNAAEELVAKLKRSNGDVSDSDFFKDDKAIQKKILREHLYELKNILGERLFGKYQKTLKNHNKELARMKMGPVKIHPITF